MVTETAYTTVDVAVTLWVDENGQILTSVTSQVSAAATTTAASVIVISNPAPVNSQPVVTSSASPSYTFSQVTTSAAAVVVPTTTTSVAAAAVSTSHANAVAAAAVDSTTSGVTVVNNDCLSSSDACSGDITHYDGGLSACGPVVDTNTAMAIALPWEFMGTLSNTNPYCGKTLTIKNPNTGATAQAYVADKCMGCTGRSIDLTDILFDTIAPSCDGRCSGFEWWFN